MMKIFTIACALVVTTGAVDPLGAQVGHLQSRKGLPLPEENSGRLLNRPYLTTSGQTVPHPGKSQIGSQTEVERRAEEESDRATRSICSNC
jgi:hypothetical protein